MSKEEMRARIQSLIFLIGDKEAEIDDINAELDRLDAQLERLDND